MAEQTVVVPDIGGSEAAEAADVVEVLVAAGDLKRALCAQSRERTRG